MRKLLFVHVPKTAGTSFRIAASKYFGARKILHDYGAEARETSQEIISNTYRRKDYWAIYSHIEKHDIRMLCGHVPARRYVHGFGVDNTVVFFREPLQRVFSEYQHFVRNMRYEGTFRDFLTRGGKNNHHQRLIENVPLQAIGFVGLTEHYDDSLLMINKKYDIELQSFVENSARDSLGEVYEPSAEDVSLALELNKKDVHLYNNALHLFKQRKALFDRGLPFTHARLVEVSAKKVVGWAWSDISLEYPVAVRVRINGEVVDEVLASGFRSQLCYLAVPRGACVSFSANYSAKAGDLVDCEVAGTGQVFPAQPIKIQ